MGNTNSEDKNQSQGNVENVKIVAVGSNTLERKEYWLHIYTIGEEEANIIYSRPRTLSDYSTTVDYKGKQVKISLYDTNAIEEYTQYRIETYKKADVVLLLFSRKEAVTFNYLKENLLPEITYHAPAVPIILIDLEDTTEAKTPVSDEEIQALKKDKRFALFTHEIVPYNQERIRRVIEVTALEAVEFTRNLPFKTKFEYEVYEQYHAELKKLKEKYDKAIKKSPEKAASAKEKLDELQKQIDSEIREQVLACKWDLYAEKLGWK